MLHDAIEHRWQRWWNAFRRRAIRDLFEEPQLARVRLGRPVRSTKGMRLCSRGGEQGKADRGHVCE
jgi:hypothetical protein